MMQGAYEFSLRSYFFFFFYQSEAMLLLSLRPSTTLVQLEPAVSSFPELLLWVDVESTLKNSTSHFFVFPETGH